MNSYHGARVLLASLLLSLAASALADTEINAPINGRVTWTAAGSPYAVTRSVAVSDTATLTIEAGVTVKLSATASLRVTGRLLVNGAPGRRVVFSGAGPNAPAGSWGGIFLTPKSPETPSRLSFVTIAGAGAGDVAAVTIGGGEPVLEHVSIERAKGDAVQVVSPSFPRITNLALSGNGGGFVNLVPEAPVEARLGFWGSPTGPSKNGPGFGAPVSSGVVFDPWLVDAPSETDFVASLSVIGEVFDPINEKRFVLTPVAKLASCSTGVAVPEMTSLRIFDGAGNMVRAVDATNGLALEWDGRSVGGLFLPAGTYDYLLDAASAEGSCGAATTAKGRVTLQRR